jgi:multiple sugar transport system substrate-binding protein
MTLWQNSAVFEAANVEPFSTTEPPSWDEVLEKAKALKAGGVEYPLGIEWQWGIAAPLQVMVEQQGGQLFSDDLKTADLNTPEALRAIQWLVDYGTTGVGVTSLNPLADGYDGPTYFAGRMAATMTGYWFGGNWPSNPDAAKAAETSTLVPTPTFDTRISAVLGGIGAYIPAQSDAKDQAWRVIEYFIGGQPGIDRATSGWGLPGLDSMWQHLPGDLPVQQQSVDAVKAEMEFVVPLQDSPYITRTQWNAILDREVIAAINGEKSAEEVAAAVTTEMNTLLAQGVDQLGE